ncbi:hypothetical protein [Flavobacterium sedimenticola]|uniref:Glycosyltransferase RgtA/B/C/D-like domain-containing protein n=1 Tax=Flavobacterium sedimenticola TaxID=3043286 RepID=A0ABT6XL68_9FLAO|nr:hypothetical protein [Flavobacterium sedimenticola]MDI9255835.1 hypothetical protein [Flavobacterium sedimenticola]
MKNETTYLLLLTAIYFVLSLVGILHHELWLDEAHHYLLARDSNSVIELIQNTRYEGHPILWNTLLYGITRLTANPFWMQFLHILISTSVVFLFLRKAPFSLVFKTLFIFGYFMFFEYNLISRNYMLGVLFLFLACSVYEKRKEKFTLLCASLALSCNVHLMFSVLALVFMFTLLWENYQTRELFRKKYLPGYVLFGLGLLSLGIQLQTTHSEWFFNLLGTISWREKLTGGLLSLFKGLIAFPDFTSIHFWNSNFIVNTYRPLASILSLLIYLVPFILFFKNKKMLFFVYIALFGTQLFFFVTERTAVRFHGMTYLIIIMALWMQHYGASDTYKIGTVLTRYRFDLLQKPIVYSILTIHFLSGTAAYATDYVYPFTASKDTADYIKTHHLGTKEIVSFSCDGTTLSPYLEKKLYFLTEHSYQSYCIWKNADSVTYSKEMILTMLSGYMDNHEYCVYVSGDLWIKEQPDVWKTIDNKFKIRLLKTFNTTILENGSYYVYEVSKIR